MAPLKIFFTDFWKGFDPHNNWFTQWLAGKMEVVVDPKPDLLIFSSLGKSHLDYYCHKLQFIGENIAPDFRYADYAISFDWLDDARHLRIPLYAFYISKKDLERICTPPNRQQAIKILQQKKGFCSFVVSNAKSKDRIRFFNDLKTYKPVASGGRALNNIGSPVADKMAFVGDYKFNIAFENAIHPGYVTEKLVEAKMADTVPIYCGCPIIDKEMNAGSFINYHQYGSLQQLKAAVMAADADDDLCLAYLQQPLFYNAVPNSFMSHDRLADFFKEIANTIPNSLPISQQSAFKWQRQHVFYSMLRNRIRKPLEYCR
jgi:hypothetical protein